MRLDNIKIVVTGGMGYVGSHTCKSLKAAGACVTSVDNRIVEQNRIEGVNYITADYADDFVLQQLKQRKIYGFVHCAGTSLVGPSVTDPDTYYWNNVQKTMKMLSHFKRWDKKPFIVFSSSAAVYGDPVVTPILESDHTNPINPYGNTKMIIERMIHDYSVAYDFNYYFFRYFNAAGADVWDSQLGPEPGDTHIIPRIFEAYAAGKPFRMFGTDYKTHDGTCVRDYIHVCDLALAHLHACVNLSNLGRFGNGQSKTYNLGTKNGYSNREIVDAFIEHVGPIEVVNEPRREGDPDILVADATLIKDELKYEPSFSDLETIMVSFRKYYEKQGLIQLDNAQEDTVK